MIKYSNIIENVYEKHLLDRNRLVKRNCLYNTILISLTNFYWTKPIKCIALFRFQFIVIKNLLRFDNKTTDSTVNTNITSSHYFYETYLINNTKNIYIYKNTLSMTFFNTMQSISPIFQRDSQNISE